MDKSNILKSGRTLGAKPKRTYREPGDEDVLPGPDDGTSSTRWVVRTARKANVIFGASIEQKNECAILYDRDREIVM
jgi:hypothetical protein